MNNSVGFIEQFSKSFLSELEGNSGFDGDLYGYLCALENISDISVDKIDDYEVRKEIDNNINVVCDFIEKYKNDHYEISLIKGFKVNPVVEGKYVIDGRDYYYYIADQKIKASVYYVRYLNFINKYLTENNNAKDELEKCISEIKGIIDKNGLLEVYIENTITKDNIIEVVDDCLANIDVLNVNQDNNEKNELIEKMSKYRQKCQDYINKIDFANIDYVKYILFDNTMREVRFLGGSFIYLWHWTRKNKTLYRCGVLTSEDNRYICENGKNLRLKQMFQDCINHMNKPSKCLHSYSEHPLLDIYKYMIIPRTPKDINDKDKSDKRWTNVTECDGDLEFTVEYVDNLDPIEFEILKDADINCIFEDGQAKSFHEYVISDGNQREFSFSVEMFPQSLNGKKNSKNMTVGLRDKYFPEYFKSWGIDGKLSLTKVADDKEVITYGKYYSKLVNLDDLNDDSISNIIFSTYTKGTLFRMSLDKLDIIQLLLKIVTRKYSLEELCKRISAKERVYTYWFDNAYRDEEEKIVSCFCFLKKNSSTRIIFNVKLSQNYYDYLKDEDGNRKAISVAHSDFENRVREYIKKWFMNRYENFLKVKRSKVDFIISTIDESDYDFDFVKQYTEYKTDEEDEEIAILKEVIWG